jgi:hypothetical protein
VPTRNGGAGVIVETVFARPSIVEKIDLLAHDANFRLSRYGLP